MRSLIHIALIFTALASCARTDQEKAFLETLGKDEPVQEAFRVKFIFSEKAKMQARLEAPHVMVVMRNEQEVSVFDEGLHLTFFKEDGTKQSDLTADYGEFKKEFGMAEVRGNVVVLTEKNERIETEKLEWNSETDSIYTREFVKVYTENEIIYGDGLRAKSDFSGLKFFHIRGAIKLEEGQEPPPVPGDTVKTGGGQ